MAVASAVIALFSLAVSGVTLVFTQFRGPQISTAIGPTIEIYYPSDGGLGVYVPATFVNTSPRTGTVHRCGITIFRKSCPDEKFFMDWRFFMKLKPELSYAFDAPAHAIAVVGTSSTTQVLWFTWRYFSTPELIITEGEYVLTFHYWLGADDKPHSDHHEFSIDQQTHAQLAEYKSNNDSTTVNLLLDNRIATNRLLSDAESKSLLDA